MIINLRHYEYQLTTFYTARYSAWNRFAHDKNTQMANIRAIDDNKPQALRVLEDARWNAQPVKANNTLKLLW